LLGIFFDPEDESSPFIKMPVNFSQAVWCYICLGIFYVKMQRTSEVFPVDVGEPHKGSPL
jgi:hypothetical protein